MAGDDPHDDLVVRGALVPAVVPSVLVVACFAGLLVVDPWLASLGALAVSLAAGVVPVSLVRELQLRPDGLELRCYVRRTLELGWTSGATVRSAAGWSGHQVLDVVTARGHVYRLRAAAPGAVPDLARELATRLGAHPDAPWVASQPAVLRARAIVLGSILLLVVLAATLS